MFENIMKKMESYNKRNNIIKERKMAVVQKGKSL